MTFFDDDAIFARIKQAAGVKKDREIAPLLGLSPQDFSNRKKRGTLRPLIVEWAANNGVNVKWILTGQEGDTAGHTDPDIELMVRERHAAGWECKGEEFSEFEKRIIGMLRRLTPETRQDHFDGITTSYFVQMEREIEARGKKS